MTNPPSEQQRRSQPKTADNLTYLEVGDPTRALVIHNHGGPSSRFEACFFANISIEESLTNYICVDRHRLGQSQSPKRTRSLFMAEADDMTTIADALGLPRIQ